MDPLSITASIIAVLQATSSIVSVCYEFRAALKKSPWSLTCVMDETRDLRNVLENLEHLSKRLDEPSVADAKRRRAFSLLCDPNIGPLTRCHQELSFLENKIVSSSGYGKADTKRRTFMQVIGWQLKECDVKLCLERIQKCKDTLLLAITTDEA
ncbi:hypothetical protein AOQ84DRAFT_403155 [Glonium stellatum]|uniref:Fungal N-terminal domain-containing protein n=1 Tax=Glonium stellatum TaxID=574774 RepID=A0A8E2JUP4_9PEZI|nr:hypothetical protein AOQ84DRAFT_403155 [Glonium stellatum]